MPVVVKLNGFYNRLFLQRGDYLAHTSKSICDLMKTYLHLLQNLVVPPRHQNICTLHRLLFKWILNQTQISCYYSIQYKESMAKKCYLMQHSKVYANIIQSSKPNINSLHSGFHSFTMSFTIDNVIYFIKKALYTIHTVFSLISCSWCGSRYKTI